MRTKNIVIITTYALCLGVISSFFSPAKASAMPAQHYVLQVGYGYDSFFDYSSGYQHYCGYLNEDSKLDASNLEICKYDSKHEALDALQENLLDCDTQVYHDINNLKVDAAIAEIRKNACIDQARLDSENYLQELNNKCDKNFRLAEVSTQLPKDSINELLRISIRGSTIKARTPLLGILKAKVSRKSFSREGGRVLLLSSNHYENDMITRYLMVIDGFVRKQNSKSYRISKSNQLSISIFEKVYHFGELACENTFDGYAIKP